MDVALALVAMAAAVLLVSAVAERLEVPPPLALIVVGVAASFLPFVPDVELEPEVVLLGLLPPLLYSASLGTSLVDFNAMRRGILLLSVGLVAFTTVGVAALVHALLPGLDWPAAFAIGAVVAPPDAVAATSIGRRIGLPRKIVTLLEGESLLNDATALVALRTALAVGGTGIAVWRVGVDFVVAAGGGALVGVAVFVVVAWIRKHVVDPIFDTALSLLIPYAAYLAAEELHASGVIGVVVAGLMLGHSAPILQSARSRIAERTNWRTLAFLLENVVFLLIGLQAQLLVRDVGDSELAPGRIVLVCAATLAAVVLLRLVWVFPARYLVVRPGLDGSAGPLPPWSHTFLLGWAGMRGVVSLAAAFVIPAETPHRAVLLLVAFTVVSGTLLLQGLSLPWLARRLRVQGPDPMDDALARATLLQQASKAGFAALDDLAADDPHGVVDLIRQRVDQRNFAAWERLGTAVGEETPSELYARARLAMIEAERRRILQIRNDGRVASEVVADVLASLDVEESMIDIAEGDRDELRQYAAIRFVAGDQCADLEHHPADESDPPDDLVCAQCERDGTRWVALRRCLDCGHVGCCDSSPGQHATEHFHDTTHPVMQSAEPGEHWRWCFVHHLTG